MYTMALLSLLFAATSSAHFLLNTPTTIGFDDDSEGKAPCGSFIPDYNNNTVNNWHVGGDTIFTTLAHPSANFIYRATLDQTANSGWVQLFPVFMQTGLGNFCEPSVPAPAAWVGQKGVVSVIANGPDGILYQCALVVFVSGSGAPTETCSNATGVTAAFTADPTLTSLLGSPSTGHNAANALFAPAASLLSSLVSLIFISGMVVLGATML